MIRAFLSIKSQCIKSEMAYKANFYLLVFAGIVTKFVGLGVPFILFEKTKDIAGWGRNEIYLVMVYIIIAEGANSLFFEGVWNIPEMVFSGKLDVLLIRPMNPLLQVLSYGVGIHGLGDLLFGIPTLIYLHINLGLVNAKAIMFSFIYIVTGTALCLAVYIISNSIVFWFDSGGKTSIPYMIANVGQYAKYPLRIYPVVIQVLLCFVIPYAFMGIVPAMIMTNRISNLYFIAVLGVVGIFFLMAIYVFNKGISKYESAGM